MLSSLKSVCYTRAILAASLEYIDFKMLRLHLSSRGKCPDIEGRRFDRIRRNNRRVSGACGHSSYGFIASFLVEQFGRLLKYVVYAQRIP